MADPVWENTVRQQEMTCLQAVAEILQGSPLSALAGVTACLGFDPESGSLIYALRADPQTVGVLAADPNVDWVKIPLAGLNHQKLVESVWRAVLDARRSVK